ncbi:MAG: hypothetical protein ACK5KP_11385, partial [Paludibacteraceae bacterium]
AKSALKSGAFSIQLDTPSAGQLYSMDMAWQIDESKITISDKSAKIAAIYFALVQSGEQKNLFLGSYAYTPSGVSATVATYVYCNKSLSIKGMETFDNEAIIFDVKFNKGWNVMLAKVNSTLEETPVTSMSYTSVASTSGLVLIWTIIDLEAYGVALPSKIMSSKFFK